MPITANERLVVVGAGPIGIEAALCAANQGFDVRVFEAGTVGEHVLQWGHVRMFSPWKLNRSAAGISELRRQKLTVPPDDGFPTGRELIGDYLQPIAEGPTLRGRIETRTRVLSIGREGIGKSDRIGGPREQAPFRLLVAGPSGQRIVTADVVIDASGTFGRSNPMGKGNVPAVGELDCGDLVRYTVEELSGGRRDAYAGKHVLVVGSGYSAATMLDDLLGVDSVRVSWVTRSGDRHPLEEIEGDPLPERLRLSRRANTLADGSDPRVLFHPATEVERVTPEGSTLVVELSGPSGPQTIEVDRIFALVGYRPDRSIYRELQVHECYATEGPYTLAAQLLAAGAADCLSRQSSGVDSLRNPEPNFFILGAKSYGRNSSFLIRVGLEQIDHVFADLRTRSTAAATCGPEDQP